MCTPVDKAVESVVNSWAGDGHPYMLKNGNIIRVYPNKNIARRLVLNGAVNDWLKDEVDYWENPGEDVFK